MKIDYYCYYFLECGRLGWAVLLKMYLKKLHLKSIRNTKQIVFSNIETLTHAASISPRVKDHGTGCHIGQGNLEFSYASFMFENLDTYHRGEGRQP